MKKAVPDGRLAIPPLPPRHVSRPRLLAALDTCVERPLTLLAAGPGSGKSVLLSDWAMARDTRPAWLSLDRDDNDPNHFWLAIAAAMRVAGLPGGADPSTSTGPSDVLEPFLRAGGDAPIVVVLDDAHVLTNRRVLHGLDECVRRWGGQLRLIIAARSDPLLALPRYRLAGQMSELRAADLAMTDDEAHALLGAHNVHLPQHEFDVLTARTEGWAAGLRLSAMSMEGTDRPADFVTEFALDQGSIGEYLMDEVLDRQPDDVRQLLIETSFLGVVNGPLAEAVTGLPSAGDMLAELSRTNSFVVPADRTASSYRYHQLLSEILHYLLRREAPERRTELLHRAARWYVGDGNLVQAMQHAVAGNDWLYAAHSLVNGGFAHAVVERLDLAPLTGESLAQATDIDSGRHPEVIVAQAALLAYDGHHEQARAELDRFAAWMGEGELEDGLKTTAALTELLIARARNDVRVADTWAARLLADAPSAGLAAATRFEQASAHFYGRAHDTVEPLLRLAAADARRADRPALELDCLAQLAHVNAFWGRFRTSRADERAARAVMQRHPTLAAPTTMFVAAAERSLAKAEFVAAHEEVRQAALMPVDSRDRDLSAEILMLQTSLYTSAGRFVEARQVTSSAPGSPDGLVGDYQLAYIAGVETALGRPNAAVRLLREHETRTPASVTSVALGRAHLARGDLDQAAAAIRPVLTASGPPSIRMDLIEALITDAQIAHARCDDESRAVESLVRALELADGEFVLPFVQVTADLAELRQRHPCLIERWPHTPDAGLDPSALDGVGDAVARPGLSEQLTDRERAVLRWLATTMSTNEIADELCLSVNTVKTHVAAIYRKLAAARRRDAVLRARELELL
jgi:LuxR family maltose regulon positive regulatory protein